MNPPDRASDRRRRALESLRDKPDVLDMESTTGLPVYDAGTDDPWEGMSLAKHSETHRLNLSNHRLVAQQDFLEKPALEKYIRSGGRQAAFGTGYPGLPRVTEVDGVQFIDDGHHRIAAALLSGQKSMKVDYKKMEHPK